MAPPDVGRAFLEAELHAACEVAHLDSILEARDATGVGAHLTSIRELWSAIERLERLDRYRTPRLRQWLRSLA